MLLKLLSYRTTLTFGQKNSAAPPHVLSGLRQPLVPYGEVCAINAYSLGSRFARNSFRGRNSREQLSNMSCTLCRMRGQNYENSVNNDTERMKKFQKQRIWSTWRGRMRWIWAKWASRIDNERVTERGDEASIWISQDAGRVDGATSLCGRNKKGLAEAEVSIGRLAEGWGEVEGRADFIADRDGVKSEVSDLLPARFVIKETFADFTATRKEIKLFDADFMSFRALVKFLWQFMGKILGGVAENV